jgi:hypothetical protein
MESEVNKLLEDSLKGLIKSGGEGIVITSREAFDAEY